MKIESLSVPSNPATARVANDTGMNLLIVLVKNFLLEIFLGKCPFLAVSSEMYLDFLIKVFLDIPEMKNLKLSPTIVETCPSPI